jgi:hypothetical protein
MDDPEMCVTVTVPQLQEEREAMRQQLLHEQKEREKLEALLEQQKQFAATSAAEASARELELKKSLDLVRTHAAEELAVAKQDAQEKLEQACASSAAAEEELAASHESALAINDQVAAQLESCMREASKAEQQLAGAVLHSNMQQQALMAEHANRISAAQHSQVEAEARAESLALALNADREALVRVQQESLVASELLLRTQEALSSARAQMKQIEADLRISRDKAENDLAEMHAMSERNRELVAKAEEEQRVSDAQEWQLKQELEEARAREADLEESICELESDLLRARARIDEVLAREAAAVDKLEGELSCLKAVSQSFQEDLDIAQGNQNSSRLTLEEEWAQRARALDHALHTREGQMKAAHEAARLQLTAVHQTEIEQYRKQLAMFESAMLDVESDKAAAEMSFKARIADKDEQIAELNQALEELEEEKGRDILALHTQHQEKQRALCARLHDFYLRKMMSLNARVKSSMEAMSREILAQASALDATLDLDRNLIQTMLADGGGQDGSGSVACGVFGGAGGIPTPAMGPMPEMCEKGALDATAGMKMKISAFAGLPGVMTAGVGGVAVGVERGGSTVGEERGESLPHIGAQSYKHYNEILDEMGIRKDGAACEAVPKPPLSPKQRPLLSPRERGRPPLSPSRRPPALPSSAAHTRGSDEADAGGVESVCHNTNSHQQHTRVILKKQMQVLLLESVSVVVCLVTEADCCWSQFLLRYA